jgi:hypothetical protein
MISLFEKSASIEDPALVRDADFASDLKRASNLLTSVLCILLVLGVPKSRSRISQQKNDPKKNQKTFPNLVWFLPNLVPTDSVCSGNGPEPVFAWHLDLDSRFRFTTHIFNFMLPANVTVRTDLVDGKQTRTRA